jgi:hypothetical protein
VHCASREKVKNGELIGEGCEELVDLIFDVGNGICKEAFGKLTVKMKKVPIRSRFPIGQVKKWLIYKD